MHDAFRRKMDKIDREEAFFNDNADDFAGNAKAANYTTLINEEKARILAFDAQQMSGFDDRRQAQEIYEDHRDELVDLLEQFALAGEIVDDDLPGTAAKLKFPRPRTDQNLIAKATSITTDAEPIKTQLIDAGLPADALTRLPTVRDAFQQAALAHDSAEEKHAEGTGGMNDSFRKIMDYSKRRGKVVKLKYRTNAAKLAAWAVASHLDRAPKKSEDPTPTPA